MRKIAAFFCINYFCALSFLLLSFFSLFAAEELTLLKNLGQTEAGDYLVVSVQNNLTLMHIRKKDREKVVIEEVSVPANRFPDYMSWKEWLAKNGPGNNHWVFYEIYLQSGRMGNYYSVTKGGWYEIPDQECIFTKLLNLPLTKIADSQRKKIGPKRNGAPDFRSLWQPRLIVDGKNIDGVNFDAWQGRWPKDGSDLSNKAIELYLPSEGQHYVSYFPYWLEIQGAVGKAKIRIIDSGSEMHSPKVSPL